jgi:hypothetical protein
MIPKNTIIIPQNMKNSWQSDKYYPVIVAKRLILTKII